MASRLRRLLLVVAVLLFRPVAHAALPPPPPSALLLDAFVQAAPVAGAAPTRHTELRLWQDARTLHVDVRAWDPEPDAIVARQLRRDATSLLAEDQVTLVIDAEGAGRHGVLFAVNAHGTQFDGLVYDGGQMRADWDAQWQSEARIESWGWSARLAIPLSVFGHSDPATWRVNAERWMPRGAERVRLAAAQPDKTVHSLGDALPMPTLRRDDPAGEGWNLRLKPSLRLVHESAAASGTGQSRQRLQPGLELFHESAAGLRTSAALDMDFGDAEADERSVNLTRFELFRPEQREFFLRDAGRFTFGGLDGAAVMPYYSRRIGLDASGRARSLDAGLKLTGSLAGTDFGALAARVAGGPIESGEPDQRSADVAVLRLARPLDPRQRVGLIATRGNPQGTAGSHLWGVDYQWRDTAWGGSRTLEGNAWAMRSANAEGGGRVTGQAWGGSLSHVNVGPMAAAQLQRIGHGFAPALGYLAEDGVWRGDGTVGWWHRTAGGASVIPAVDWSWRRTLDGRERSLMLNPEVEFTNAAGDTIMVEMFFEQDRLGAGHAPLPGTRIAPGSHRWRYFYAWGETSRARPLWLAGDWRAGGYYGGRRQDQSLQLGVKPGPQWEAQLGLTRRALRLPAGRFTLRLATLRLDYTPSTRLASSLLLQWDNVSQALGASARLHWRWAPGRELILALDRLDHTGALRSQPAQTRALLKLVVATDWGG